MYRHFDGHMLTKTAGLVLGILHRKCRAPDFVRGLVCLELEQALALNSQNLEPGRWGAAQRRRADGF